MQPPQQPEQEQQPQPQSTTPAAVPVPVAASCPPHGQSPRALENVEHSIGAFFHHESKPPAPATTVAPVPVNMTVNAPLKTQVLRQVVLALFRQWVEPMQPPQRPQQQQQPQPQSTIPAAVTAPVAPPAHHTGILGALESAEHAVSSFFHHGSKQPVPAANPAPIAAPNPVPRAKSWYCGAAASPHGHSCALEMQSSAVSSILHHGSLPAAADASTTPQLQQPQQQAPQITTPAAVPVPVAPPVHHTGILGALENVEHSIGAFFHHESKPPAPSGSTQPTPVTCHSRACCPITASSAAATTPAAASATTTAAAAAAAATAKHNPFRDPCFIRCKCTSGNVVPPAPSSAPAPVDAAVNPHQAPAQVLIAAGQPSSASSHGPIPLVTGQSTQQQQQLLQGAASSGVPVRVALLVHHYQHPSSLFHSLITLLAMFTSP